MSDMTSHISDSVSGAASRYRLTEGRTRYLLIDARFGYLFAICLPLSGCMLAALPAISVYIILDVLLLVSRTRMQSHPTNLTYIATAVVARVITITLDEGGNLVGGEGKGAEPKDEHEELDREYGPVVI